MIALLCAIAQGAWAQVITFPIQYDDVWDGHASTKPTTFDNDYLVINTAAELVYAREHWQEKADNGIGYYEQKYSLNANLNMGLGFSWKPMKISTENFMVTVTPSAFASENLRITPARGCSDILAIQVRFVTST